MKKINYKKIFFIIIIIALILSISTLSYASLVQITPGTNVPGGEKIKSISGTILGVIQIIAVAVAVIMLVVLAIKYMAAAPSEKGEIKKSLIMYAVGALILFSGAGLLNIIQAMGNQINKSATINENVLMQTTSATSIVELA